MTEDERKAFIDAWLEWEKVCEPEESLIPVLTKSVKNIAEWIEDNKELLEEVSGRVMSPRHMQLILEMPPEMLAIWRMRRREKIRRRSRTSGKCVTLT